MKQNADQTRGVSSLTINIRLAVSGILLGLISATVLCFVVMMSEGSIHRLNENLRIHSFVYAIPEPLELYWAVLIAKRSKVMGIFFAVSASAGTIALTMMMLLLNGSRNWWIN